MPCRAQNALSHAATWTRQGSWCRINLMNCCKKLTSGVTTAVFLWNLFLSGRCVAARLRDVRSLDQTHEYIAKAHISAYVQCVFCFEPFCRFHSMIIAIMYVCNVYVACVCVCMFVSLWSPPISPISSWFTEVLPLTGFQLLQALRQASDLLDPRKMQCSTDLGFVQWRNWRLLWPDAEVLWLMVAMGYCQIYVYIYRYIPTPYSKTSNQNVSYWWLLGNASCMQDSWRLNRPRSTGRAKDITVDVSSIPNVRAICFWSIVSHWMDGFWVI